jgi:hypothetical protein
MGNCSIQYAVSKENAKKGSFSGEASDRYDRPPMMTWDQVFGNDDELPDMHEFEDAVAIQQIQVSHTAGEVSELLVTVYTGKSEPLTKTYKFYVSKFNVEFHGSSKDKPVKYYGGGIKHVN